MILFTKTGAKYKVQKYMYDYDVKTNNAISYHADISFNHNQT